MWVPKYMYTDYPLADTLILHTLLSTLILNKSITYVVQHTHHLIRGGREALFIKFVFISHPEQYKHLEM